MPGVPSNVPTLPPGWPGSYSGDNTSWNYLIFFVLIALVSLLVGSIQLAKDGNLLMSAILAIILALSILAIIAYAWFRFRIPNEQLEDET